MLQVHSPHNYAYFYFQNVPLETSRAFWNIAVHGVEFSLPNAMYCLSTISVYATMKLFKNTAVLLVLASKQSAVSLIAFYFLQIIIYYRLINYRLFFFT